MKIINKIHKKGEWVEYNPIFLEEERIRIRWGLDPDYSEKHKVEVFNRSNRIILKKEHDELHYTVAQSNKGIKPPVNKQTHYHYYFAESVDLGTYTCSQCQEVKKHRPSCCKEPMESFFEHSYDGGDCHACYDEQTELLCVKCFIRRNLFTYNCRLEDNGDYVIKS